MPNAPAKKTPPPVARKPMALVYKATPPKVTMNLPDTPTTMAVKVSDHMMMFYGPPGVGKTTLVNALAPKVFFISTDRGTRHLTAIRRECTTWTSCLDVIAQLEMPNAPKYDIVCIDHVDDWAAMSEDFVCKKLKVDDLSEVEGGWGKGWKALKLELRSFIRRLLSMNMGVVFIAHEDIREVKTRSVKLNRTMPLMPKTSSKIILPLCDIVGYCGFRTFKDQEGKRKEVRVLETVPREDLYAKDRTKRKKPEKGYEFLDGQKFVATFGPNMGQ